MEHLSMLDSQAFTLTKDFLSLHIINFFMTKFLVDPGNHKRSNLVGSKFHKTSEKFSCISEDHEKIKEGERERNREG